MYPGRKFEEISYHFIPKDANKVAHVLAKEGRWYRAPCFWVEETPNPVEKMTIVNWNNWI
ncbi:hypothetical protein ES332_D10G137500v1 [Gossypium tomentosum]|uniref:RNase H type-1 domain-containing protein n=1 Tax=Gossypium tomentosum TaxID=34277 RepID=A0A5D2J3Z1_GOSTO|nr:hypothetical protein ES332_D10G137500v1 [Gossypium tomentosum]